MKIYVKAAMSYDDLSKICKPIQSEIVRALRESNPDIELWNHGFKDNGDGTLRISLEIPLSCCNSIKEARKLMQDAINRCSKKLQDSLVKITCGQSGDRGRSYFVVSAVIRPSTNDYYGVHDIE